MAMLNRSSFVLPRRPFSSASVRRRGSRIHIDTLPASRHYQGPAPQPLKERFMPGTEVSIAAADGTAAAWLFKPAGKGPWPGTVMFIDALGVRPAMMDMAERLAGDGYVVLMPNLFYRSGPIEVFSMSDFANEERRGKLFACLGAASFEAVRHDSQSYLTFLGGRPEVSGAIGCFGYCFGGSRAVTALGAYPDRVKAAAAFHASQLATDAPDSPHLLAPNMNHGRLYVGIAGIDQSVSPEEEGRLASALRAAEVDHTIENYPGVRHGFTVSDTPVYDRPAAERAWDRLLRLFKETLH
jgi:carboxymethylenebutenolidase